ncbi:MAG TPA: OmpA family protein [Candidatus Binatia bacterium]|nr:OmpA family protein [Candidatus Binatia bacterium]
MRGVHGALTALAVSSLLTISCSGPPSKREVGALGGAALGAGAGALIGHATGNTAAGAAIGGALGGVGGAVVGDQIQAGDQKLDAREQEIARNRALIEELKRKNLEVHETNRGVVVNLPDVLFEFNKYDLTSDARVKVRDIAEVLDGPRVQNRQVSIEGHTDSIGSDEYNLRLSQRRAEAVSRGLAGDGVSASRLHSRGFGKKYPIAPNKNSDGSDNPAGRAKNRRVEVIIEN